ncbi:fungal class II heme-containing peroxidase [Saxophila tyrrhenica]|uniref:Peroxidase n=1 Tax=Saxophila tyrrhenica TaxID=1690608 RepID=A0AAV9PCW0_9PEZI|nr:fungal class II heme-containing peroxidase [Saxophila tyrrhenica]
MKQVFAGCTEPARSSIRFAFHDSAGYSSVTKPYGPASGGADGSLLLNDDEIARTGNAPMPFARTQLKTQWEGFKDQNVTAADFVQISSLIAVRSCGGPAYKMLVGREDDDNACPQGTLPAAFGQDSSYDVLVQLWAEKGIDERELAALMGAHTVSRAFAQQSNGIPPPDVWNTAYDAAAFKLSLLGVSRAKIEGMADRSGLEL